ncbi:putative peptidyl-tRNA hydrolase [Toxoplasma gondii TgCatPRC2]|uniref:peptidyl-tRNA hydrolase n=6 Tax=Toxoplasma gondii TaxID=5811 RepID=S7UKJ2_TOXGG|nr:peptidyl-tRNA hydrolase, putative [Toxoplasma gondii ME49]EPR58250.1 putative peptidyl-tRNA hydrolase [Toxoplasma gondii GT1]EPT31385.1 peptidyl-tRNA hydrolase, putative [Toxoplasma gondii ME49]KAF4645066.1 putative peptidyl-tRNA hydrolase [Toxoplasma gondii]KYK63867.1 putative peptidyl-tRNA hydrolase [Toxoplasma gondii TgCatPRC2]|eukprot:XP_002371259.1 peptidyl-tRNA hydrolase, putative [Toxoplasma gondii ME49]
MHAWTDWRLGLPAEAGTLWWIFLWLSLGACLGLLAAASLRRFPNISRRPRLQNASKVTQREGDAKSDPESGDSEDEDGESFKMVLCVRQDLSMGKGKIAAQCGHATLGAYRQAARRQDPFLAPWTMSGQKKIAVKIKDETEMLALHAEAKKKGVNAYAVCDAGRTQVPAGSLTVLAVGPGPESLVDDVTGRLKLL